MMTPPSSKEKVQLEGFKTLLIQHGYALPSLREGSDDTTLMRFLRAQNYNCDLAFNQFHYAQTWRKKHHIREFYENVDGSYYEDSRRMIGRRDIDGNAVYVFPVRRLTKSKPEAYLKRIGSCPTSKLYDLPPADLHFHALYENLVQFVFPLVSALPRPHSPCPISASTHIVDINGVGTRQFWGIRKLVVGAPAFFKSIWEVINQWSDPVTRSKIHILSADEAHTVLRSYIEPSNLPVAYGGSLDWRWEDLPKLDASARRLVNNIYDTTEQNPTVPEGPAILKGGCFKLLGSVDGKKRRDAPCPR
ncbi:CRAL-TRIO domain-containing protein [Aspergillus bertholletiae]|uniref:CRAL-TRIO domain-containing protein n=1 Tax=Aspergillus bertholletiae TaxID=1226010 RepID=A0A5N7B866_9EURO|nr:CRAL-TRIO domain-containing protein [Aspergillus bertholletiae]